MTKNEMRELICRQEELISSQDELIKAQNDLICALEKQNAYYRCMIFKNDLYEETLKFCKENIK